MTQALIDTLRSGGCYWPAGPGALTHSRAIPQGTHFKIALDGETSSRFISGVCVDGHFQVTEGARAGERFPSANAAVTAVRGMSTNAFLYVHFLLNGRWIKADNARETEALKCDPVEEEAFQIAAGMARGRLKQDRRKVSDIEDLDRKTAEIVAKRPEILEEARRRLELRDQIDINDLDLSDLGLRPIRR